MSEERKERLDRQELLELFIGEGLGTVDDEDALMLLLDYVLPGWENQKLVETLLTRFGNFRAVLEADYADLRLVPGVTEEAAVLLRLVNELNHRYQVRRSQGEYMRIRSTEDAGNYVMPMFAYSPRERLFVVTLNAAGAAVCCHELGHGLVTRLDFPYSELLEHTVQDKAANVILAHNHLSNVALPSEPDVDVTEVVYEVLKIVGVGIFDHIIVADQDYVSMRDSRLLDFEKNRRRSEKELAELKRFAAEKVKESKIYERTQSGEFE